MAKVRMRLSDYITAFVVHCAGTLLASVGLEISGKRIDSLISEIKSHRIFLIYNRQHEFEFTPEENALKFCQVKIEKAQKNPDVEAILEMVKNGANEFLDSLAELINEEIKKNSAAEDA